VPQAALGCHPPASIHPSAGRISTHRVGGVAGKSPCSVPAVAELLGRHGGTPTTLSSAICGSGSGNGGGLGASVPWLGHELHLGNFDAGIRCIFLSWVCIMIHEEAMEVVVSFFA
jgi:hypothetical protein